MLTFKIEKLEEEKHEKASKKQQIRERRATD